ncbi:MAG: hypothetical protein GY854_10605 [Deltaproteobacteria bacterium]|nr:hypothetical protein [Deltaproteobacteria bacterium]
MNLVQHSSCSQFWRRCPSNLIVLRILVALVIVSCFGCGDTNQKYTTKENETNFVSELAKPHGDWVWLGTGDNRTDYYFFDKRMIEADKGDHTLVWIKKISIGLIDQVAFLSEEKKVPAIDKMPHDLLKIRADCSELKYKLVELQRYDVSQGEYKKVSGESDWQSALPGTVGQSWYLAGCSSEQSFWAKVRNWLGLE